MPFQCAICEEESHQICVFCTKDTCGNHICEKCLRCSDCCGCEVPLEEYHEPEAAEAPEAAGEVLAAAAGASTSAEPGGAPGPGPAEASAGAGSGGADIADAGGDGISETGGSTSPAGDTNVRATAADGSVGGAETLFGAEPVAEPAGIPAEDVAGQAADKDLSSPGHV